MPLHHNLSPSRGWPQFLLFHAATGSVIGLLIGAGILVTDVLGVGELFMSSDVAYVAGALYFLSFASLFAAASTATAIMNLKRGRRR